MNEKILILLQFQKLLKIIFFCLIIYKFFEILKETMESQKTNRILRRIQDHGPIQQITQLCLDQLNIGKITQPIRDQIAKGTKLEFLSMNSCKLQDIEMLPHIPNLFGLELMNNKLKDSSIKGLIQKFPHLLVLAVDKNDIKNIQVLKQLENLEFLEYLELRGNPLCNDPSYIQKIFQFLPNLKAIDGTDIFGDQRAMQAEQTDSEDSEECQLSEQSNFENNQAHYFQQDEDYGPEVTEDKGEEDQEDHEFHKSSHKRKKQ